MKSVSLSSNDKAISRFMSTERAAQRVYFFNPLDAKSMVAEAKRNHCHVKMNFVTDDKGDDVPYTRRIDLNLQQHEHMKKENFSGSSRSSDSEVAVADIPMTATSSKESIKVIPVDEFLEKYLPNEQDNTYSW